MHSEKFVKLDEPFATYGNAKQAAAAAPKANMPMQMPAAGGPQRKALTSGCNYYNLPKGHGQLAGCINDSNTWIALLTKHFGFKVTDIRQLRDDKPHAMPTKANLLAGLDWLVQGAKAGDELFFHYSGHGAQIPDTSGDEDGGEDDALIPCDFKSAGLIVDDELRSRVVLKLPKGVRFTAIMDCCHSGTALDLAYKVILHADNDTATVARKPGKCIVGKGEADVVMLSGCQDNQTSADIQAGADNALPAGAMTTAFKHVVTSRHPHVSAQEMLREMRQFLKDHRYTQVPQLSSEQFLDLDEPLIPDARVVKMPKPLIPSTRPPVRKALTVGINYMTLPKGHGRLSGCINDSDTMIGILTTLFEFPLRNIRRLRDDSPDPSLVPTKSNILKELRNLLDSAQPGDELFFHYSGHGGQQADTSGDERDGKDECLIPCDFRQAGLLPDDVLRQEVVLKVPE